MKIKNALIGLFLVGFGGFGMTDVHAQKPGHKIDVEVKHLDDTLVYLAYRYGDQQYLQDTTEVKDGKFTFEGKEPLPGGVYTIVSSAKAYMFEFLVDEQHFSVRTDTLDYLKNLSFTGSKQNAAFLHYQKYMQEKGRAMQKLSADIKAAQTAGDKAKEKKLKTEQSEMDTEVKAYQEKLKKEQKGTLLGLILEAQKDIIVPDEIKEASKSTEENLEYWWYKKHYFDHIDFTDERLVRTPLFHSKLSYYFEKLVPQHPDSLIHDIDWLFAKIGDSKEYFKYAFVHLYNKYNNSKLMCIDKVFVHLALNYYTKEKAFWASDSQIKKIRDRAIELAPTTCGSIAPNMRLKSPEGEWYELHKLEAPVTVLFFWDPDCGHCKKALPDMLAFYDKYKDKGVKVMAVCTQQDQPEWREMIKEKDMKWINVTDNPNDVFLNNFRDIYDVTSTPVIFVLDENKNIIGKKLGAAQLGDFVEHVLEQESAPKK